MEVRLRKPKQEDLSIHFTLAPFITQWASTQERFMTAIARELGDLLSVRPQDFYINPSVGLGEVWCKYKIFGGASTIVLHPDALRLDFKSVNENDRPTIIEIIRWSVSVLQQDIGSYTRCYVSLTSNRHVETVGDGSVDRYLNQFALQQATDIVKTDSDLEYRPAAEVILSHKGGDWSVHRLVGKSGSLPDGLFINTLIFIPSFDLAELDKQVKLIDRIFDLADKAVELSYVGDSDANANS